MTSAPFAVDEKVIVAIPAAPSESDRQLARIVTAELADQFGIAVKTQAAAQVSRGARAIVLGKRAAQGLAAEGYELTVTPDRVTVAGSDDAGAFYGVQSLRQLMRRTSSGVEIQGAKIRDWPYKPFRGVKIYLPGRDNIPYFKRFVRDFMALHKYNKVVLELNAAMRLDKHPELNAGWLELGRNLNATRRDRPSGPNGYFTDSVHHDTGDFGILEKDEVRELVRFAAENHVEVIPEIPSMTHSYYLLTRHRELAEIPDAEWPDTYCPSLDGSYQLLFDVLDEYIDVMKPRMIHAGKDEWRMPLGVCPRCRNKDYRELYLSDVRKTYDHLKKRGVEMAIWGDHLIEPLRGAGPSPRTSPTGYKYNAPGAITPEQARALPKDILMFNWFWDDKLEGQGEVNDKRLEEFGFQQVYGNMTTGIPNYARRSAAKSVIGGASSSWAATTESNFGKDLLYAFLGCANMLWSTEYPDEAELGRIVQRRVNEIQPRLAGTMPASAFDPVAPIRIARPETTDAIPLNEMRKGEVRSGNYVFDVGTPAVEGVEGKDPKWLAKGLTFAVNDDASSIVFLHALARPASNNQAYRRIYSFDDTADLLGWYEVEYEDGFVTTIPVRYRVNILEWSRWRRPESTGYSYRGNPVELGADPAKPVTFWAFEWNNPRLGKVVKEVRLHGTTGFTQMGKVIGNNAILVAGISVVKKRPDNDGAARSDKKPIE